MSFSTHLKSFPPWSAALLWYLGHLVCLKQGLCHGKPHHRLNTMQVPFDNVQLAGPLVTFNTAELEQHPPDL